MATHSLISTHIDTLFEHFVSIAFTFISLWIGNGVFSLLHCVSSEDVCLILNLAVEIARIYETVLKRFVGENWRVLLAGRDSQVSQLEKINIKYRISDRRKWQASKASAVVHLICASTWIKVGPFRQTGKLFSALRFSIKFNLFQMSIVTSACNHQRVYACACA